MTAVVRDARDHGDGEAPFETQLRSLESAAAGFARARALDSIAGVADGTAAYGLGAGLLVLAVRDEDERELRVVGAGQLPGRQPCSMRIDGAGLLARVTREGAPAFVPWTPDALVRDGELRQSPRAPGSHRLAVVPLPGAQHPVGAIALGRPSGRGFSDEDCAFLTVLAGLCALAVERVRLSTDRSHVRALLRRRPRPPRREGTQLTIGRMCIDLGQLRATADGRSATLTPSEFRVLMFLAEERGRAHAAREERTGHAGIGLLATATVMVAVAGSAWTHGVAWAPGQLGPLERTGGRRRARGLRWHGCPSLQHGGLTDRLNDPF